MLKCFRSFCFVGILAGVLVGCDQHITHVVQEPTPWRVESLFAINHNGSVELGWTPVQQPLFKGAHDDGPPPRGILSEIVIHRSSHQDFIPTQHSRRASVGPTVNRFMDMEVENGHRYYYRIVPVEQLSHGLLRYGAPSNVAIGRPTDFSALATAQLIYSEHIQPIFTSGCAVHGCHVGEDNSGHAKVGGLRKTLHGEQFSMKSWEDVMRGGIYGNIVVPYSPRKSHLIYHLNNDTTLAPVSEPHMPLEGFQLPRNQIELLMRWIGEGATNDMGAVAYSVYPQGRILATNQSEDLIAVIDVATRRVARYIQAGVPDVFQQPPHAPHSIRLDRQKQYYYVCLIGGGRLLKYRASDNALMGELGGLTSPSEVAVTISGDSAYVAQFGETQTAIRLINTRTMSFIGPPISHPSLLMPHGMHLSRDGRHIYITGYLSDNILVLTVATGAIEVIPLAHDVPPIPIGPARYQPYYVEPSRDDRFIYVSCSKSNEVRIIERDSMRVVDSIAVGSNPLALDITPDNQKLYVANLLSNSVSVISTSQRQVIKTIHNVGVQPHGVKVTGDGRYVFVSLRNLGEHADPPHHPTSGSLQPGFVAVIDAATDEVIQRIEVGGFAAGLAFVD